MYRDFHHRLSYGVISFLSPIDRAVPSPGTRIAKSLPKPAGNYSRSSLRVHARMEHGRQIVIYCTTVAGLGLANQRRYPTVCKVHTWVGACRPGAGLAHSPSHRKPGEVG